MVSSLPISVSGMRAAETRLGVAANNTANLRSTVKKQEDGSLTNEPYRAQDTVQISGDPGVRAEMRESTPATRQAYDPSSPVADDKGMVETPNVDLEKVTVERVIARRDYEANLKALQASVEMTDSLLEMDDREA